MCQFFFTTTSTTLDKYNVTFFPKHFNFPAFNSTYFLYQSSIDIISLLTKPPSSTNPSLTSGDTACNSLPQVTDSLQRFTVPPSAPDPPVQIPPPVQLPRGGSTTINNFIIRYTDRSVTTKGGTNIVRSYTTSISDTVSKVGGRIIKNVT